MRLQLELPGSVRVVDQTTHKGHQVTVAHILGNPALYFIGEKDGVDNQTWEDILSMRISDFLAKMLANEFPEYWSTTNPTGRELYDNDPVVILKEEKED
jgi:hypothetical protein